MPLILLVPTIALIVGVVIGVLARPGRKLQAGAQHLAGGVIFGAVAVEIVPFMEKENHWTAILAGLAAGAGLMLLIRGLRRKEESIEAVKTRGIAGLSVGLLVAFGIDLVIDGMLVSIGVAAGDQGGLVLGVGIGVETLFLGAGLGSIRWRASSGSPWSWSHLGSTHIGWRCGWLGARGCSARVVVDSRAVVWDGRVSVAGG